MRDTFAGNARIGRWAAVGLLAFALGCASQSEDIGAGGTAVGAAGATVSGPDGAKVEVPPGALSADTPIAVARTSDGAPPLPAGFGLSGSMFAFTPHGTQFATPVTVTMPFDPASVPSGRAVALYKTTAQNQWEQVTNASFGGTTVSATVTSFSYAQVVIAPPSDGSDLVISAIEPVHGPADTRLTLTGSGFSATSSDNLVTLNNKPCSVKSATPTELVVEIPAQAGSGNLQVTAQSRTAMSPMFTYDLSFATVSTFAGLGLPGDEDGVGTEAQFDGPSGVAFDAGGTLFVADVTGYRIRAVSPTAMVTTFAGTTKGYTDGVVAQAQFSNPYAVVSDVVSGDVFVADVGNDVIRKIDSAGLVTTFVGTAAGMVMPSGLAHDGVNLYVADKGQNRILKIDPSGAATTFAGGTQGVADGTGAAAQFHFPEGLAFCGEDLFVADTFNMKIRKITRAGEVSTYAGGGPGDSYVDGSLSEARFLFPSGLACDGDGKLFVVDTRNERIRMITPSGMVSTLAGTVQPGFVDGDGATARFSLPLSIAVDKDGSLLIADTGNQRIRKIVWQ